jgi:hypothetical protein
VENGGRGKHATDDNIRQRMRFAYWVTNDTDNTLRICTSNTYCFSTTTMVSRRHLSVTLCVHCLSSLSPLQIHFWLSVEYLAEGKFLLACAQKSIDYKLKDVLIYVYFLLSVKMP